MYKKIIAETLALTLIVGNAAGVVQDVTPNQLTANADTTSTIATQGVCVEEKTATFNTPIELPAPQDSYNGYYRINFTAPTSGTVTATLDNAYSTMLYKADGTKVGYMTSSKYIEAGNYYIDTKIRANALGLMTLNFVPSKEATASNTITMTTKKGQNKAIINGFFATDCNNTVDTYKVSVPENTGIKFTISNPKKDASYRLDIINNANKIIATNKNFRKDNPTSIKLNKGTYTIKITDLYPFSYPGEYKVSLIAYNPTTAHKMSVNKKVFSGNYVGKTSNTKIQVSTNNKSDKITFKSSNKKILTVNKYGRMNFVRPGKAYVTIFAKSTQYGTITKKIPVIVRPAKVKNVRAKKISYNKQYVSAKISWARDKNASGYIVKYSNKVKGTKLIKPKKIKLGSNKKNSFVLKNRKIGKDTYVSVTAYKKIGKKYYYGPTNKFYYRTYYI